MWDVILSAKCIDAGSVKQASRQASSPQNAQMIDLMEQVASGSIDPEMAATYVQQLMTTTQVDLKFLHTY